MSRKVLMGKIGALLFILLALLTIVPVTSTPEIMIEIMEPRDGPLGTKVYMMGSGATPMGPVIAFFDDIVVATVLAYREGDWEISFLVPNLSPGEYVVTVLDNETSTSDSVPFIVTAVQIKIRDMLPTMGLPGTAVSLSGYGASPEGEVKVSFDAIRVAETTATEWGDWYIDFNVPWVEPGDYTVYVLDVNSNSSDSASFTVTLPPLPPTLTVSPSEAPIGSRITISGEGFTPQSPVYLTFEDLLLFTFTAADENGEFNATVFVPTVNSGNYTIKAIIPYPGPEVLANTTFTVTKGLDALLSDAENAQQRASSTQNMAEAASSIASEAKIYALLAMVFALIAAVLSGMSLKKRK